MPKEKNDQPEDKGITYNDIVQESIKRWFNSPEQKRKTQEFLASIPFRTFGNDEPQRNIEMEYNDLLPYEDFERGPGMGYQNVDPRKTFRSIQFSTSEATPTENSRDLAMYSKKMAKGELTWKERMYFAMLVLQREIDGYVGENFYSERDEYLRNTVSEILTMDHNKPVPPIDVTPNLDYLSPEQKWEMFEKWEPTSRVPKYKTQGERPDNR